MDVFIARQPIFDKKERVKAYELLYRDGKTQDQSVIEDTAVATKRLVANAITVFDIQKLSNSKRAFINFDCELVMNDFARNLSPEQVIIDLDESVLYQDGIVDKIREYKSLDYKFAIQEASGNEIFSQLVSLMDVISINTGGKELDLLKRKVSKYHSSSITMLAQKIETREDFELMKSVGFDYYQGYFFEKPVVIKNKSIDTSKLNYFRLINELNKPAMDFIKIASIIKLDSALVYQLFKVVNKVEYGNINATKDIMDCILRLGEDRLRNWLLLIVTRRFNDGKSDEFSKFAYIRGMFMEKLMEASNVMFLKKRKTVGYFIGMFSLLPMIADMEMSIIISDLKLERDVADALLGIGNGRLKRMLDFTVYYETGRGEKPDFNIGLTDSFISRVYADCIFAGDVAFRNL